MFMVYAYSPVAGVVRVRMICGTDFRNNGDFVAAPFQQLDRSGETDDT